MKISKHETHIIVAFTQREKDSGLTEYLESRINIFDVSISEDKSIWKVRNSKTERFINLIHQYQRRNSQLSLF